MKEKRKVEAKALHYEKTSLESLNAIEYQKLTQEQVDELFSKEQLFEYADDELNDIISEKQIQELIYGEMLEPLDMNERNELVINLLLDIGLKSVQVNTTHSDKDPMYRTQIENDNQDRFGSQPVRIENIIGIVISNGETRRMIQRIVEKNGTSCIGTKMIREYIDKILHQMSDSNAKNGKTWRRVRTQMSDLKDIEHPQEATALIIHYKLTEVLQDKVHFNNYQIPRKEQPSPHIEGEELNRYMLRNGVAQSQQALDVLNHRESTAWQISKYANEDIMQQLVYKKMRNKNKTILEAINISKISSRNLDKQMQLIGDSPIYFPSKYDAHTRVYDQGYIINPQGSSYEKQTIVPHKNNFINDKLTDENKVLIAKYLAFGIASAMGHDKLSFDERVEIGKNIYCNRSSLDKKAEYFPGVMHYLDCLDGMKHDIYPNAFVPIDATNNVFQLYAVLTGDKSTAELCNLANGSIRADGYKIFADKLNEVTQRNIFNRDNCKKALMIKAYGSNRGHLEIAEHITNQPERNENEQAFITWFNEDTNLDPDEMDNEDIFQQQVEEALGGISPSAMKEMKNMIYINSLLLKPQYYWTLPDGVKATYRVKIKNKEKLSLIRNQKGLSKIKIKFTEEVYMASKKSKGLAANIIQSIDAYVVRLMVRRFGEKKMHTIHDEFSCHPEHVDEMIQHFKDIMCELLQGNLLNEIYAEILGTEVIPQEKGDLTCEDIQNSDYALS